MTTPYTPAYANSEDCMQSANDSYLFTANKLSYEEALEKCAHLVNLAVCPMSPIHLGRRGQYPLYPTGMVTHNEATLYVRCVKCGARYCTDAWRPYGYETVYQRSVRSAGDGNYMCINNFECK